MNYFSNECDVSLYYVSHFFWKFIGIVEYSPWRARLEYSDAKYFVGCLKVLYFWTRKLVCIMNKFEDDIYENEDFPINL